MTDWTQEEDEAFNDVEKHSNLGKQILRDMGQPYHWETEAIKTAVLIEREACAKLCDYMASRCDGIRVAALESAAENIRARNNI
jgi:hypothetical protein